MLGRGARDCSRPQPRQTGQAVPEPATASTDRLQRPRVDEGNDNQTPGAANPGAGQCRPADPTDDPNRSRWRR